VTDSFDDLSNNDLIDILLKGTTPDPRSYPAAEAAPPWKKMAGRLRAQRMWRRGSKPVNL
jgi:hypothetical protein